MERKMDRRSILLILSCFILGIGVGILSYWYFADHLPQERMMAAAKVQQEQMNKMVRSGEVTDVKSGEITITVKRSGDPAVKDGTSLAVKTDNMTTLQDGSSVISKPGQVFDLTKYLKQGMYVDVLDHDGKAVAIHWEGQEQQSGLVGQEQSQAQSGKVQKKK